MFYVFPDNYCIHLYRPQTKLREGNVFTPVCQSFCSRGGGVGVCLSACWDTSPGQTPHPPPDISLDRHPPGQTPPMPSACWDTHTPCPVHVGIHPHPPCPVHAGIDTATAADGMHPTGMHSCCYCSPNEILVFLRVNSKQRFSIHFTLV